MNSIIQKIEKTLEVLDPVLILILGTLHLTGALQALQTWEPIFLVALGAVSAIAGIWTNAHTARIEVYKPD
jgi:hypothetical protein